MDIDRKELAGIGMFDAFKGIGILLVILGHGISLYKFNPISNMPTEIVLVILIVSVMVSTLAVGLMPTFFVISGYGFRKRPMGKFLRQHMEMILKPYFYVTIATIVLHLIAHYTAFHDPSSALKESIKMAASFLLGLPETWTVFGVSLFTCGPCWYILAMMWGMCILNFIMNHVKEAHVWRWVLLCSLIGWLIGIGHVIPFSLSQGLIAVLYVYAGYRVKKSRFIMKKSLGIKGAIIVCGCFAYIFCAVIYFHSIDSMANGTWTLGFISVLLNCVIGVILSYYTLNLNAIDNVLVNALRFIGRNSLYFFCVHTVEMMAIPWYLFAAKLADHPFLGLILQTIIRVMLNSLVCALILNRKVLIEKAKTRLNIQQ